MEIDQKRWTQKQGWENGGLGALGSSAQLVLVFGGRNVLQETDVLDQITQAYPKADIAGCSTSGEIDGIEVTDDSIVLTAIYFEDTNILGSKIKIGSLEESYSAGKQLADSLEKNNLVHVFILSDGLHVNGSELARALNDNLPEHVTVTGGLAGDGDRFEETLVFLNDKPASGNIVVLGFYGERLKVGYGSLGGWDPFGLERLITRSESNVLFELDGKSALDIYKEYLGEQAEELPASGLLFPLAIREGSGDKQLVRTILSINENDKSMTFAGDVPEGHYAQFMKANFDRLVDGAIGAARSSHETIGVNNPDLALLISCVGRKLVLKQRIEEEVEGVRDVLGDQTPLAGFYSYGEISPLVPDAPCELHNQTMTITTFSER